MMVGGGSQYGGHHHPGDLADLSFTLSDRDRHHSTVSLLDSIERRTQRTYRYGIGLVCIGATLNWLGFAQGNSYIDPLRYLGVACVISGSFCVCLAMCRWLGRPISLSGHRVSGLEEDSLSSRVSGEVHVINVAVPMYMPSMHEEYRPQKPPDYDIVAGEPLPPPYYEAIKLSPGTLFPQQGHGHPPTTNESGTGGGQPECQNQTGSLYRSPSPCALSPSHSTAALLVQSAAENIPESPLRDSPPPPYHPCPSHYAPPTASLLNTISQSPPTSKKYLRMSAEQEHLLGRMMSGQRSEEIEVPRPLTSDLEARLASSEEDGKNVNVSIGHQARGPNSNANNQLLNYQNQNASASILLHQSPILCTDGNGNPSSSILIDSEANRLIH